MTNHRTTLAWAVLTSLALLVVSLLAAPQAGAQAGAEWPHNAFTCRAYRQDLYWQSWARRHCGAWAWRRWRRRVHAYQPPKPVPDAEVMAAQIRLGLFGYEIEADGFLGPATKEAIEHFQEERDLDVTGLLDRKTRRALEDGEAPKDDDEKQEWSRRPDFCRDKNGRECTCDPIVVFSGEHVSQDAETEALKRWRGHIRALIGETFMNWENAPEPKVLRCWHTGTGERVTDKFGQTRCVAQARACFGPPAPKPDGNGE